MELEEYEENLGSCWMTLMKRRGYWKLKKETVDRPLWKTRLVARQTTWWITWKYKTMKLVVLLGSLRS